MWRYRLTDHEPRLLAGIQRLQNHNLFCDTLLQTTDVSVPAHSCILAALSPYLSQMVSASPSRPSENHRRLQLGSLSAATLLKLVGLLYSGQLRLDGAAEKDELLAAARRLGIRGLEEVEVGESEDRRRGEAESEAEIRVREAGVQTVRCDEEQQATGGSVRSVRPSRTEPSQDCVPPNPSNLFPSSHGFSPSNDHSAVLSTHVEGTPNTTCGGIWNCRHTPLSQSVEADGLDTNPTESVEELPEEIQKFLEHIMMVGLKTYQLNLDGATTTTTTSYQSSVSPQQQGFHSASDPNPWALSTPTSALPDPNPQSAVEESPEELQRLMEDIGLRFNLLQSSMKRNCIGSHSLQPNADGAKTTTTTMQSSVPQSLHSVCDLLAPDFTLLPAASNRCPSTTPRKPSLRRSARLLSQGKRMFENAPIVAPSTPHPQHSCRSNGPKETRSCPDDSVEQSAPSTGLALKRKHARVSKMKSTTSNSKAQKRSAMSCSALEETYSSPRKTRSGPKHERKKKQEHMLSEISDKPPRKLSKLNTAAPVPEQNWTPEHAKGDAQVAKAKQTPTVTLKQFQHCIRLRHQKAEELKRTNQEVSSGTGGTREDSAPGESEIESESAQIAGKSEVKTRHTKRGFPCDRNPRRIVTAKNWEPQAYKCLSHVQEETVAEKEAACACRAVKIGVPSEDGRNENAKEKTSEQTESPSKSQDQLLPCFDTVEEFVLFLKHGR